MRTESEIRDKIRELEAKAEDLRKNPQGKMTGNMIAIIMEQAPADILKWALENGKSEL